MLYNRQDKEHGEEEQDDNSENEMEEEEEEFYGYKLVWRADETPSAFSQAELASPKVKSTQRKQCPSQTGDNWKVKLTSVLFYGCSVLASPPTCLFSACL